MLQIFRVAGIPVRVDPSWLLVFGLISWSLAAGYFPSVLPQVTTAAAWVQGVAAALLLFVSVFLHELSHALVALEHGVPVSGIRLHVFGGVSELEAEPPTPRAEFLIAIVGPLTSFVIAALCYGIGQAIEGPPWAAALTGYLAAGSTLTITSTHPTSGRTITAKVKVLTVEPDAELRWVSKMLGRTISERTFQLSSTADGTSLMQAGSYSGLGGGRGRAMISVLDRVQDTYTAINEAIKQQAEARQRASD